MKKTALTIICIILCTNLGAQDSRQVELTAQEILARVDEVMKYPTGELQGDIMHIFPDGKSVNFRLEGNIGKEDYIFTFSSPRRGKQLRVLYNLYGEDIWVYNLLSLKLFHKVDVDKYDPLLDSNFNFLDLSNADFQSNYTSKIIKTSTYKGKSVIILSLDPIFKGGEYGKLTLYVVRKDYIPMRIDYHDQDRVITKTLTIAKIAQFNNRTFPVRYDMLHISSGTLTILQFNDYDGNMNYPKTMFRHEQLSTID
ncbi:MAG: outer membrane lipoprotein-sorting protein [Spirochaetota bacterium]